MKLIEKKQAVPELILKLITEATTETTYTVKLTHKEFSCIHKALGKVSDSKVRGSGELYSEFGDILGGNQ